MTDITFQCGKSIRILIGTEIFQIVYLKLANLAMKNFKFIRWLGPGLGRFSSKLYR